MLHSTRPQDAPSENLGSLSFSIQKHEMKGVTFQMLGKTTDFRWRQPAGAVQSVIGINAFQL